MHRTRRRSISFFGKNRDGHQRRLVVLVASPGPSYPAEVGALAGGACRIRRCVTRVKVSAQIWGCVCRKRRSLIPARPGSADVSNPLGSLVLRPGQGAAIHELGAPAYSTSAHAPERPTRNYQDEIG